MTEIQHLEGGIMSNDLPEESPTVSYLKGYNYGISGIMGSDNPGIATWGALDADRDRERQRQSESQSSSSGGDGGAGLAVVLFLVLISPPFFIPGYAVYLTWLRLSDAHWHPFFKLLAEGGEIFAICAAVWVFYRFIPRAFGAVLAGLYIGACYGWAMQHLGANQNWMWIIAGATGLLGFFLGRKMHQHITSSGMTFRLAGRTTFEVYATLAEFGSFLLYWVLCLGGGGWGVVKFFRWLDGKQVNGYAIFALCLALAVTIAVLPAYLGGKLARKAPLPVAATIFAIALIIGAGYVAHLAELDTVWTLVAILSAGVGGVGLARSLATNT